MLLYRHDDADQLFIVRTYGDDYFVADIEVKPVGQMRIRCLSNKYCAPTLPRYLQTPHYPPRVRIGS